MDIPDSNQPCPTPSYPAPARLSEPADVLEAALRATAAGQRVALAAVVATRGSTPQPPGALLCIDDAARVFGTLGGGCVEADVRRHAHHLLTAGRGEVVAFDLDHDDARDDGMICGGRMEVAIQVLSAARDAAALSEQIARLRSGQDAQIAIRTLLAGRPVEYRLRLVAAPRLVIAGGGHIGRVLAELAHRLGFVVSVIDDRAQFANTTRFPPPMNAVGGEIAPTLRAWPIDPRTYIVIVTRGHAHDQAALEAVLGSPARFIGMIGSARKVRLTFDDLLRRGANPEALARVAAPIGLPIHAVTPEEIALSIAAQLTQVRRAERECCVDGPFDAQE